MQLSASEIVAAIRDGRITAERYVAGVLERVAALAHLNAMISIDSTGALAAARQIDALPASGASLPLLAGVPIMVKDSINSTALPTTGGTAALEANRPTSNAPSLQKLLDAGAILIGKSNLHELAFGATTSCDAPFARRT